MNTAENFAMKSYEKIIYNFLGIINVFFNKFIKLKNSNLYYLMFQCLYVKNKRFIFNNFVDIKILKYLEIFYY